MAPTLLKQWHRLTPAEQAYLRSNPHHAFALREARDAAFLETTRRFGKSGHNNNADAFRHCFWSAVLVRELGFDNASRFTAAHETLPDNPAAEESMDLHNNRIGLSVGRAKGTNQSISLRCMAAL